MFNKLLLALGLRKDVGAPVHVGVNPVYFTYVYELELTWAFSWHTADHKQGATAEYWSKEEAQFARNAWETKKANNERATFVRP